MVVCNTLNNTKHAMDANEYHHLFKEMATRAESRALSYVSRLERALRNRKIVGIPNICYEIASASQQCALWSVMCANSNGVYA